MEDLFQLPYAGVSTDSSAISGIWLSTMAFTYTFTGDGNWDVASNWSGNLIPPPTTFTGSQIIINNVSGGQCILNVPYIVNAGTTLTVLPNKNLQVNGNLKVN